MWPSVTTMPSVRRWLKANGRRAWPAGLGAETRVVAVLLITMLTFFFRVLVLDTASIPFDLQDWQYPRLAFMGAALRRGNFPLWNPYLYGGMPMPADRCFTRYAWQPSG